MKTTIFLPTVPASAVHSLFLTTTDKKRDRDRSSVSKLDQLDPIPAQSNVACGSAVHLVSETNLHTNRLSTLDQCITGIMIPTVIVTLKVSDSNYQLHSHFHFDVGDNPRVSPINKNDDENSNDDSIDDAKEVNDKPGTEHMDFHDPDIEDEPETGRVNATVEAKDGMKIGRVHLSIPSDDTDDPLLKYKRAQLAARIQDQKRNMLWFREKSMNYKILLAF